MIHMQFSTPPTPHSMGVTPCFSATSNTTAMNSSNISQSSFATATLVRRVEEMNEVPPSGSVGSKTSTVAEIDTSQVSIVNHDAPIATVVEQTNSLNAPPPSFSNPLDSTPQNDREEDEDGYSGANEFAGLSVVSHVGRSAGRFESCILPGALRNPGFEGLSEELAESEERPEEQQFVPLREGSLNKQHAPSPGAKKIVAGAGRREAEAGTNSKIRKRSEDELAMDHLAGLFQRYKAREAELRAALSQSEYQNQKLRHQLQTTTTTKDEEILDLQERLRCAKDDAMCLQRECNILKATASGADAEIGAKDDVIQRLRMDVGERDREMKGLKNTIANLKRSLAEYGAVGSSPHGKGRAGSEVLNHNSAVSPCKNGATGHLSGAKKTFIVTGFRSSEKQELERHIKILGGAVVSASASRRLPPEVTHVVAGSLTPKVISGALTDGVWVVGAQFVHRSYNQNCWLTEENAPLTSGATGRFVQRGEYDASVSTLRNLPLYISQKECKDAGNVEVMCVLRDYGIAVDSDETHRANTAMTLSEFVEKLRPGFLKR